MIDIKNSSFMEAQKNQAKLAACQSSDVISEANDFYSANETEIEVEQETDIAYVAELVIILETIVK